MSQTNPESLDLTIGIEAIKKKLERADQELFENLRLFVERIMLYRLTRAEDKSVELGIFARILTEVGTLSENPESVLSEISGIESLAKEKLSQSEETNLFSTMVRATESLDSKQLYYLLEKLRTESMEVTAESA
ncbi:MAG: hypothetical protein PXY39_08745 [archaeon]|jgi:hypothetical protein|nr:hypothetical protein [archaeon]